MIIAIVAAAIMIAYFVLIPDLEMLHVALFISFWFSSFVLDLSITVANKHLMHYESNILFPTLIEKYGTSMAIVITFMIEITFMCAMPFLFIRSISLEAFAVSALALGTAHLLAFTSNIRFVRKNR